jgi:hypothetical protein
VRENRVPIQPSRRRGLDPNAGLALPHHLGQPLRAYRRHLYWTDCSWLAGGLEVLVASYGAKDYATNRLTLPAAEVRRVYRGRAQLEEVIRVCKDQLGLTGCQARSARAQWHPLACCLIACCVLERGRHDRQLSIYKRNR